MDWWQVIVLGVIQGLTEFLPISSTAHLLVAQELMGRSREELKDDPFTVVIQIGTLAAVYWYFRADIARLFAGFFRDLREGRLLASATPDGRNAKLIIVGTLPVIVVGLLFHRWLKATFYNPQSIAWVAIAFALLMALSEWWSARRKTWRGDDEITYLDALFIGCFQAMALMPGGSRSGTTITAGLFTGLARPTAARFSFLLSLPSVLAAGLKELYDWFKSANAEPALREQMSNQAFAMIVGALVSGIVGYFAIAWLLHYLRQHSTLVFIIYRVALGITILVLIAQGWFAA